MFCLEVPGRTCFAAKMAMTSFTAATETMCYREEAVAITLMVAREMMLQVMRMHRLL